MTQRVLSGGDTPGWKTLVTELNRRDAISAKEVARLVKRHTGVTTDYALRRLQRTGVLRRPNRQRRGLYVVGTEKTGAFIGDPIEAVQAVCGNDTVFGYGTALFLHGLSRYGRLSEYYVVSSTRRNRQAVGSLLIRIVRSHLSGNMGLRAQRHGRRSIRVTDLERTLIDCIHRPKYAQGWENVAQALKRAQDVRATRMIDYLKQYRTPSLVAKVGLILDHYSARWKVSSAALNSLRPYLPRTPVKFSRERCGSLNKNWNIYVPEDVFHE